MIESDRVRCMRSNPARLAKEIRIDAVSDVDVPKAREGVVFGLIKRGKVGRIQP